MVSSLGAVVPVQTSPVEVPLLPERGAHVHSDVHSHWGAQEGGVGVGLPAPLDHPARDGPLDSLHHGQVLPVVVGLQEKPVKTLKVEVITT